VADPIQTTYDELPYINRAFPQTHPDRLATLARLFGLEPPDIGTCRVLELGCASGDNLIPMALELPKARFVGIDLSARQIGEGQSQVRALGLTNIELRQFNIADVDASWGMFDFVISHGIYSWVPAPVRERLLAICRDNLARNGVAYVSYNTLPGWHMRGMVRDMMIYHAMAFPGAAAKVRQARGLIDFLAQSAPANSAYGMALRQELEAIKNEPDAYLFHDHLEENNEPFYFHQFADAAKRHGLEYLGEADFNEMLMSNFPPKVAETLRQVATDAIRMEQYMDFLRNRMFRQTLLVHQGAAIRRNLDGLALKGLLVTSSIRPESPEPVLAEGASEVFHTASETKHTITDALTKSALVQLAQRWPRGLPFEELAALSHASLRQGAGVARVALSTEDLRSFGDRMLHAYAARVAELRVAEPRLVAAVSARPVASPLARLQAERGTAVTNLRHEPVVLPDLPRRMLPLLDGTRDIDALVAEIVKLAQDGRIGVREQGGGPMVSDPARLQQILRQSVIDNLAKIAYVALLLA